MSMPTCVGGRASTIGSRPGTRRTTDCSRTSLRTPSMAWPGSETDSEPTVSPRQLLGCSEASSKRCTRGVPECAGMSLEWPWGAALSGAVRTAAIPDDELDVENDPPWARPTAAHEPVERAHRAHPDLPRGHGDHRESWLDKHRHRRVGVANESDLSRDLDAPRARLLQCAESEHLVDSEDSSGGF